MEKKLYKNNNYSSKISSLYFRILFELEKVNYIIKQNKPFDPLLNLLKDIEGIKYILKSNSQNVLNFLYFNMDNIERILYNEDEIIYFDYDNKNFYLKINQDKIEIEEKNEIVFLFYISLLIKYNKNIVNFSFSFDFINKINSINKIDVNNLYKNILISKIILELIHFYKSNQIFNKKNSKEIIEKLNEIEKVNNEIIENYFNDFIKLGLKITQKELKLKNIDLIYSEIINILLKSRDYNLIKKIDLENINITKSMFNEISKTFFSNEIFINEYRIDTFDDLLDSKKIDFYYILFKYILKNSIYIYNIDFLNKARKTIIKIINLNQNQSKNLSNNSIRKLDYNFKDKTIYIIKFFTNSDYYVEYINLYSNLADDTISLKSQINNSLDQSLDKKSKENQSIQSNRIFSKTIIKYNNLSYIKIEPISYLTNNEEDNMQNFEIIEKILKDSFITLNINNSKEKEIEYGKIEYFKGLGIMYERFRLIFSEVQKYKFELDTFNILFKNYKKLIDFLEKIKEIAYIFFSKTKLKLLIKIKLKEDKSQNNDNSIKNIISEYFLDNFYILSKKYQDKNIFNNNKYEGFTSFSKEIVDSFQNKSKIKLFSNISSIPIKSINTSTTYKNFFQIKYNFINFIKVIAKHREIAEKIKEIDNENYVSDGYNEIFIYDIDLRKIDEHIFENYYSFFIDKNKVIISQKNKFTFLDKLNTNLKKINTKFSCRNLLKFKNNKYLLCNENGLYFCMNGLKDIDTSFELNKISFRGAIEITEEIIAITSNSILSKGENKIIFLNAHLKRFLNEIEVNNYSFTLSENNCALMKIPKDKNCKLLLFACKKYRKDDRNGILLLKLKIYYDNRKEFKKFYDTKNFEVYCFCPILKIDNKTILGRYDKTQAIETEYFFVGGFDLDKREGLIKLYKVIYDDEIEKIEIKFIQDIIIKKKIGKKDSNNFNGFKGPISCIIQSSKGEILVTCYDGNVYLFSEPNIDSLNQDYNILKYNV